MPYSDSNSRPPSPEPAPAPPPNSPRDGVKRIAKAFRDGGGPIGDTGVIYSGDSFYLSESVDTAVFRDSSRGGFDHLARTSSEVNQITAITDDLKA